MKPFIFITSVYLMLMVTSSSCKKILGLDRQQNYPPGSQIPPPPPPPPDTLSGHVYVFDSLTWGAGYDTYLEQLKIFITTPSRPDLFFASTRPKEVSWKYDTSNIWINTQTLYYYAPGVDYYFYYFHSTNFKAIIVSNLDNPLLVGNRCSVKVKFL